MNIRTRQDTKRCREILSAQRRTVLLAIATGTVLAFSPCFSFAEDEIDIAKISAELSKSREEAKADTAADMPPQLDEETKRLREEEMNLLRQLSSGAEKEVEAPPQVDAQESAVRASLSSDQAEKTMQKREAPGIEVVRESEPARVRSIFSEPLTDIAPHSAPSAAQAAPEIVSEDSLAMESSRATNTESTATDASAATAVAAVSERSAMQSADKKALEEQKRQSAELRRRLEAAGRERAALQSELEETRNRLILAETEVERLSSIIEERKRRTLASAGIASEQEAPLRKAPVSPRTGSASLSAPQANSAAAEDKVTPDMKIATVMVDKAALRTGPGKENSQLMAVSRGTRLAVETRQGEWYRVVTPHGTRAWIATELVAFGAGSNSAPTKTVRGKGYNATLEDEALQLLRQSGR